MAVVVPGMEKADEIRTARELDIPRPRELCNHDTLP